MAGIVGITPDPKAKNDLPLLAVGQFENHLHGGTGIESDPHSSRQVRALHRRRIVQVAVTPEKLDAIAGQRTGRVIDVEEGDTLGEFRAVGVAGIERAAARGEFGTDMHGRLGRQIAQHPLDVSRGRQRPRAARFVAHLEYRKLHRCVGRHENPEFADDTGAAGLENAVTEAMANDVGQPCPGRQ